MDTGKTHLHDLHDLAGCVRVQSGGGLVQEEHPRVADKRNAHVRALRLSANKPHGSAAADRTLAEGSNSLGVRMECRRSS